jgi:cell division transport system permease protein
MADTIMKQTRRNISRPGAQPVPMRAARYNLHSGRNIIPRESVAGNALATVIAIMAFLACLTVGAVTIIEDTAATWRSEISREATIQIRPFDEDEMEDVIRQASRLVLQFDGVARVTALDRSESEKLLEPWLGTGLDLTELPVPRLLTVTADEGASPDYGAIRDALENQIPGASLDDHHFWTGRLSAMAWTMVAIGTGVLTLVLSATILTVIFATRGAMAGNRSVVDVLHFVGADRRFIARQFERHFLVLGLRGAILGGAAAAAIFLAMGLFTDFYRVTPQSDQLTILFGRFAIPWYGFTAILAIVVAIAVLVAATSRFTVLSQVGTLERYGRDIGGE